MLLPSACGWGRSKARRAATAPDSAAAHSVGARGPRSSAPLPSGRLARRSLTAPGTVAPARCHGAPQPRAGVRAGRAVPSFVFSYGLTVCVTLPACLRWSAARARQAELACALEVALQHSPDTEAASRLAEALQTLIARLRLPTRLRDVGVSDEDMRRMAHQFAGGARR